MIKNINFSNYTLKINFYFYLFFLLGSLTFFSCACMIVVVNYFFVLKKIKRQPHSITPVEVFLNHVSNISFAFSVLGEIGMNQRSYFIVSSHNIN